MGDWLFLEEHAWVNPRAVSSAVEDIIKRREEYQLIAGGRQLAESDGEEEEEDVNDREIRRVRDETRVEIR
eukprot:1045506-Lingulodinium_polyedra.AAC.1